MKLYDKMLVALCLALIACLAAPAVLPGAGVAVTAQAASKVRLNKTKATVYNGQKLELKVKGTKKTVKWSTSDASVAGVSKKGVVKAKKVGTATITARVGKRELSCKVTVKSPLSAKATSVKLKAGKTKKIALTWQLLGTVNMKWDDASVIDCKLGEFKDKKGTLKITALCPGTSTITLSNSKTRDTVRIKVTVLKGEEDAPLLDKTEVTVKVGATEKVKVTWPYDEQVWADWPYNVTCTWGDWNGSGWPLTIKGLEAGTSEIVIRRGDGGPQVAAIKVTVE